jgi:dimeric dUTPase (all-alpha-NTP-PPase superfamily)
MDALKQMFLLQQKLNDATSGEGWEEGLTNKGKPINWVRCIYLEAAELVDSYPWKHWKNIESEPDYDNIKIEVVDIWHFVMSEALRDYKMNQKGDVDGLVDTIQSLPAYKLFSNHNHSETLSVFEQINEIENFIKSVFSFDNILDLVNAFFEMSSALQIHLNELYKLYIGKNVLNQFRQDHGYKEGHYIKNWDGKEDNVVLQKIMEDNNTLLPQQLYDLLEQAYPKN